MLYELYMNKYLQHVSRVRRKGKERSRMSSDRVTQLPVGALKTLKPRQIVDESRVKGETCLCLLQSTSKISAELESISVLICYI